MTVSLNRLPTVVMSYDQDSIVTTEAMAEGQNPSNKPANKTKQQ